MSNEFTATQNRRQFLKSTSLAAAGLAALGPRTLAQSQGANDRIVLGAIGVGGMGQSNLNSFLDLPGVEIAAVCVNSSRARRESRDVSIPVQAAMMGTNMLRSVGNVVVGTPCGET